MSERVPGTAVIGLQWGDEAKGKVTDIEARQHDVVVRYQGGKNAGHSVDDVAFHAIPSGVIREKLAYIASGCAVDLPGILEEIHEVEAVKTRLNIRGLLHISPEASIVQPHQILNDLMEAGEIGTTGKGIGPHYSDKARRMVGKRRVDLRVGELVHYPEDTFRIMRRNLKEEIERAHANKDLPKEIVKAILKKFGLRKSIDAQRQALEELRHCIDHDPHWLFKRYDEGNRILLEGAQAEGLDLVRGTTPYVTSSRLGLYAGLDNTGLPREAIGRVIGVGKLETSRVGYGPFVSEFGGRRSELYCMKDGGKAHTRDYEERMYGDRLDEMLASGDDLQMGKAMRVMTGEYGITSKRARRIGAFDAVQFAQAARINEVTDIVLSKLDVMNIFSRTKDGMIPVVTGYTLDGEQIDYIPTDERTLRRVKPEITYYPAFAEDISSVRFEKDLPRLAREFIHKLQEVLANGGNGKGKIKSVGVGPAPDQMVHLNGRTFGRRRSA
ncbi:MAG TPA: adenylosuccinate synthetase [Candidatus Peribacteraceae bacterium]|nr:adenylosuccinate synthetase [Candidatus Peribacteraceae bacterium]